MLDTITIIACLHYNIVTNCLSKKGNEPNVPSLNYVFVTLDDYVRMSVFHIL